MANLLGFSPDALSVFALDDFSVRMAAMHETITPRLKALAMSLAPRVGKAYGLTLYPHVAAHLRRRVNPPEETWCALSPSARSYKSSAHLAIGTHLTGAYFRLVTKDEATGPRARWARHLAEGELGIDPDQLPAAYCLVADGLRLPVRQAYGQALAPFAHQLTKRSHGQAALGLDLVSGDPTLVDGNDLAEAALFAFVALRPLFMVLNGEKTAGRYR